MYRASRHHVTISITEGRSIRDLFYNGLLDYFQEAGFDVTVFTEAVNVPTFISQWKRPGVDFEMLFPYSFSDIQKRAFEIRRRTARLDTRLLLKGWLQLEEHILNKSRTAYVDFFRQRRTSIHLSTHVHLPHETELISSAHRANVSTVGMVRSWDNVYKGIKSRPKYLAVWNEINKQEVVDFEGYSSKHVQIVGAPQFDPYFLPNSIWTRDKFAQRFDLDPNRPIILFATLGYFIPGNDETYWMDQLLEAIDTCAIERNPQVICRLHPWSRYEHFEKYSSHPSVRLSYVSRYWPALTWYMTRDDVIEMANIIHHSAVVITPGSTVTLEAAIFDRPTIVPVFHGYQPDRMANYFSNAVMGRHFGRLEELGLVPIIRDTTKFASEINKALTHPSFYQAQRAKLVRDYVYFTDGCSTKRLAELVIELATIHPEGHRHE